MTITCHRFYRDVDCQWLVTGDNVGVVRLHRITINRTADRPTLNLSLKFMLCQHKTPVQFVAYDVKNHLIAINMKSYSVIQIYDAYDSKQKICTLVPYSDVQYLEFTKDGLLYVTPPYLYCFGLPMFDLRVNYPIPFLSPSVNMSKIVYNCLTDTILIPLNSINARHEFSHILAYNLSKNSHNIFQFPPSIFMSLSHDGTVFASVPYGGKVLNLNSFVNLRELSQPAPETTLLKPSHIALDMSQSIPLVSSYTNQREISRSFFLESPSKIPQLPPLSAVTPQLSISRSITQFKKLFGTPEKEIIAICLSPTNKHASMIHRATIHLFGIHIPESKDFQKMETTHIRFDPNPINKPDMRDAFITQHDEFLLVLYGGGILSTFILNGTAQPQNFLVDLNKIQSEPKSF
ncbi:hypothetical protein BLNAU_15941 [Blattamonas nauphoetae]|uniref:Uncharacterized protein n=1 Tax=Blattamonas nauphoetae TaxID=2049346 RepID=A0ABQ9XCM8_9EUKA|nr:hypothetical protein BLNAU_15941 [Blattamonas nauphoetae]